MTEAWNREELYNEIWEEPMVKLAPKYGISAVMIGKVCRKLRIPVPGRGYWARKEAGKPVRLFIEWGELGPGYRERTTRTS